MSEGFSTTYAKAVDDLAGKIFVPGLIASLLVEIGPWFQTWQAAGLIETYIVLSITGALLAGLIFLILSYGSIYLFNGQDIAPIVAIFIMPLGFAGLFPDQFIEFQVPYTRVTGVAILAWSFMLLSRGSFGEHA